MGKGTASVPFIYAGGASLVANGLKYLVIASTAAGVSGYVSDFDSAGISLA